MRASYAICLAVLLVLALPSGALASPPSPVADAAKKRDLKAISDLLHRNTDANVAQPDGATALHWAAHWGDLAMAAQLIAAGAHPNVTNDYGVAPINLAAENGDAKMLDLLLKAGARVGSRLPSGETPLMSAARAGKVDAVDLLIGRGADLNVQQTSKGQNALMWAVAERHLNVVRILLEHGADVNAKSSSGFTALMFAGREGDSGIAELLLAKGADVNAAASDGSTPLLVAAVRAHVDFALLLLDRGAKADGDFKNIGYTPLHWASTKIEGIIQHDYQNAPGEWAALAGIPDHADKIRLIKALIAHGADRNARVTKDLPRYGFTIFKRAYLRGATPFYLAAVAGDAEIMRLLVDSGADPSIPAQDKTTPLVVAAGLLVNDNESVIPEGDHLAAVKLAVELGSDVDAVNDGGFSALHAAAYAGFDSIVQFLADKGANLNQVNKSGQSPLGIAEGNTLSVFLFERPSTAALLRKLGAKSIGAVTSEAFLKGDAKEDPQGGSKFNFDGREGGAPPYPEKKENK
jgi:ankyrin repeat protein